MSISTNSFLQCNHDKCQFYQESIKFLGHIIDKGGVHPDPERLSALWDMKPPTDVTQLCRFMGMTTQLGKFSPIYLCHNQSTTS